MKRMALAALALSLTASALAQQEFNLPLSQDHSRYYEAEVYRRSDSVFHTAVRPYRMATVERASGTHPDSVFACGKLPVPGKPRWLRDVLDAGLNRHLLTVNAKDFYLTVDPIFDGSIGQDSDGTLFSSVRGARIRGSIAGKLFFASSFAEGDVEMPGHVDRYHAATDVLPGFGRVKSPTASRYNYSWAEGYLSFNVLKGYINVQAGQGRHFIGDGYRSLLLSDNAFAYPYLKLTTDIWRLRYVNLWTQFQNYGNNFPTVANFGTGLPKKYGSFHYLSMDVSPRFQIGFFEGIIWQGADSLGNNRGPDASYFNPVIFFRPVEFSLGSPDNAMMGLNARFLVGRNTHLYAQGVLDDVNIGELSGGNSGFVQQKFGLQLGVKAYDAFGVKNLYLRGEVNQVRPYTYAHKQPYQNHSHQGQALAHPLGANFREFVGEASWRYRRFYVRNRLVAAQYGADAEGEHNGQNIFISDFDIPGGSQSDGHFLFDGTKTDLLYNDFELSYIVNPLYNFKVRLNVIARDLRSALGNEDDRILTLSFVTDLYRPYQDF